MTYEAYQTMVEGALVALRERKDIPDKLNEAMAYSLLAGGKRLRPVLMLAAYHMLREDIETALPYATAIEMIHTYSLIHDDLPAMDNDELRRGKPTNHVVFGEGMAILAGDGLIHMAFETILKAALTSKTPENAIAAAEAIARRSGVTGMVAGQTVDVTMEGQTPTEELVSFIHTHKTADLITAPIEAGLKLAGATQAQIEAGMAYGFHLGMAFQMVDDILDIIGDEKKLGKKTGMDAVHDKLTWPALVGLEQTQRAAAEHIENAIKAIDTFGESGKFLKGLAKDTLYRVQ